MGKCQALFFEVIFFFADFFFLKLHEPFDTLWPRQTSLLTDVIISRCSLSVPSCDINFFYFFFENSVY